MNSIGIVGAGAWGTALAATARRAGRAVTLWARESELVADINATRRNSLYLPDVELLCGIRATTDLAEVAACDVVLLVTPAQHLGATARALAPLWRPGVPAVICAKGIEQGSHAMMTEVVERALPTAAIAVLSGPTFAIEVARGLPTAVTLACADVELGQRLVDAIGTPTFRPYLSDDLAGAEIGGAVKNVLAIACGIVEGRGLGDNARAALITRGMAELTRLAVAKGGRPETLMGLAGLGDLILTASSAQSRNYSLGFALGEGRALADILAERRAVTEGVWTAGAVVELAGSLGIEMPICAAVDAVINQGAELDGVIRALLSRPFRSEGI
ncbi:NAD(P)H-dependent glycerol-3-phosphate dehydrogenase [Magnetospirillum aberrantis]|uniref:Glycerol-3-phosphate dehydrogenase [NAD(P)+] n=1 Tax=Magnetospirillum aberrantis SpK TaxID=908842 RepID=A0A7C9UWB0_9PROT|nr:NAD(P)H-dependent glycerol-3-phosphate dehydrogenase [Magnetospirillum aberrantis]NFV82167.1 NAD(P)-dependent glycerol-3-phosphate dehydrogenase [Magnetospirillum aberrantis SpK]